MVKTRERFIFVTKWPVYFTAQLNFFSGGGEGRSLFPIWDFVVKSRNQNILFLVWRILEEFLSFFRRNWCALLAVVVLEISLRLRENFITHSKRTSVRLCPSSPFSVMGYWSSLLALFYNFLLVYFCVERIRFVLGRSQCESDACSIPSPYQKIHLTITNKMKCLIFYKVRHLYWLCGAVAQPAMFH